jgi:glycosyl transferase, family 25
MFLDAFDSIRILNLPHRKDRRAEMAHELERMGVAGDPRVAFVDAIARDDPGPFGSVGAHGCFLSHLATLEEAASAGQRVLILEDDCDFAKEARSYELPADWDIFYGGYLASDPEDLANSDIIGAHCMGYSPTAAKALAGYLRSLLGDPHFKPDAKAAADPGFEPSIRPPFDGAIVWFRRANPELKTVFAQVAVQRSSRSDIAGGRFLDRIAPGAMSAARQFKNGIRKALRLGR